MEYMGICENIYGNVWEYRGMSMQLKQEINHGVSMDKLDNWLVGSVENGPLNHDKP